MKDLDLSDLALSASSTLWLSSAAIAIGIPTKKSIEMPADDMNRLQMDLNWSLERSKSFQWYRQWIKKPPAETQPDYSIFRRVLSVRLSRSIPLIADSGRL